MLIWYNINEERWSKFGESKMNFMNRRWNQSTMFSKVMEIETPNSTETDLDNLLVVEMINSQRKENNTLGRQRHRPADAIRDMAATARDLDRWTRLASCYCYRPSHKYSQQIVLQDDYHKLKFSESLVFLYSCQSGSHGRRNGSFSAGP